MRDIEDDFFKLSEEATIKTISARRVCRVICCGKVMTQQNVYTDLDDPDLSFAVSKIYLKCQECDHIVVLELLLTQGSKVNVWKELKVEKPYAKK